MSKFSYITVSRAWFTYLWIELSLVTNENTLPINLTSSFQSVSFREQTVKSDALTEGIYGQQNVSNDKLMKRSSIDLYMVDAKI